MSSSSNRPAIQNVKWLNNHTIYFLGESSTGAQQVFAVDCHTKHLDRLTSHSTSVVEYAATSNGEELFFAAQQAPKKFLSKQALRSGIVVSSQVLSDLMSGEGRVSSEMYLSLFATRKGDSREALIKI